MTDADLLAEAAAELYAGDPAAFTERRGELAAAARAAGQAAAAKQITALRKPTQSAWIVNQLVRSVPTAASQLAELGADLRVAQRTLNGAAIRELSQRRRELVDDLTQQAFAAVGQQSPPAALREEVATTLGAALADPQIADEFAAGAMVRAARSDGFGSAAPLLSLVPDAGEPLAPPAERAQRRPALVRSAPARPAQKAPARKAPATAAPAPVKPARRVSAAVAEKAQRAERRRVIAEAEKAAAQAQRAADAATKAEQNLEARVEKLEEQLAEAREQLSAARLKARRARNLGRQAAQSLERKRAAGTPPAR